MNTNTLLRSISDDVWHLKITFVELIEKLKHLDSTTIMLFSNGVMSGRTSSNIQTIQVGSSLTFPELGFSFQPSNLTNSYMYAGAMNHRDICIEFSNPSLPESLCISFNLEDSNLPFIKFLTSSVHHSSPRELHREIKDKYSPSCLCCLEKQKEVRNDTKSHPLSQIFHLIGSDATLQLSHEGNYTHAVQEFKMDSKSIFDGFIYLYSESSLHSIDLTQVYSLHIRADVIKDTPHSIMVGFNSQGKNIFEISQLGLSPFYNWDSVLRAKNSPFVS